MREDNFEEDNFEEDNFEEEEMYKEYLYFEYKDKWESSKKQLKEQADEIKKLNNIITKLEKELREDYKIWMCNARSNGKSVQFGIDVCKTHFYNRLQELKEEVGGK